MKNPPAFPIVGTEAQVKVNEGMTLLDYFASNALQGILSSFIDFEGCRSVETRAAKAYEFAKAMLTEREQHL